MDVEREETGVFQEEMSTHGDDECYGKVNAEREVASKGILQADRLGVGCVGAIGVPRQ